MPALRDRCSNDWAVAVKDHAFLQALQGHLRRVVDGKKGSVDEVKVVGGQIHFRTRRRISYSAASDWISRQVSNIRGGQKKRKLWTLQAPSEEVADRPTAPAIAVTATSEQLQQQFLVQKTLMLLTQPSRLPVEDDDLVLGAVLGEGTYGFVRKSTWRQTPVAVKLMRLAIFDFGVFR